MSVGNNKDPARRNCQTRTISAVDSSIGAAEDDDDPSSSTISQSVSQPFKKNINNNPPLPFAPFTNS